MAVGIAVGVPLKRITFDAVTTDTGGNDQMVRGYGSRRAAADVDAARFLFSSGNIASGRYHVIGLKV